MARVTLGSEKLLASGALRGQRVGLVCNPASVDGQLRHIADLAFADPSIELTAIFGPQHGVRSDVQENMIETGHEIDPRRQVPVYSLYSETREPTAKMLENVDVLVIDLQDVGTRIYTYIYTMANCLVAAKKHDKKVIVCDRPNPIGGLRLDGPVLAPGFESFVGQYPIPMRHAMTIGELARLFNEHSFASRDAIGASLQVVAMDGWHRAMHFDDTHLLWVPTSPNIPTLDSCLVFPGVVLFEGTNVSEGRGTTRPFEFVGAPWIDAHAFVHAMNARGLSGVVFRAAHFEPMFHKGAKQVCGGCQIHVVDRERLDSVALGCALLEEFFRQAPGQFAWRSPPYEYEETLAPIDILYGSAALRESLDAGKPVNDLIATWPEQWFEFNRVRERYLRYPS